MPVNEQNKAARGLCSRFAATHGTCGFANGHVNCNKIIKNTKKNLTKRRFLNIMRMMSNFCNGAQNAAKPHLRVQPKKQQ